MKPGDIHWVELPIASGHEQAGRRPAVVLQDEERVGTLPVVLVVPLTTARGATRFKGTVVIAAGGSSGLRSPSIALVFQLRAVDRQRIREHLGTTSPDELAAIYAELDLLTGRA